MTDTTETLESTSTTKIEMPDYLNLPYRRGVGVMVVNADRKVFVGKRTDTRIDAWQMPQGGIDGDETTIEAGIRELYEETNLTNVKVIAETKSWLYYDIPEFLITKLWEGKYRGQKQKWLLLSFSGTDSEVDLKRHTPEFEKWQWVTMEDLPNLVISFKKKLYLSVIEEFAPYIEQLSF